MAERGKRKSQLRGELIKSVAEQEAYRGAPIVAGWEASEHVPPFAFPSYFIHIFRLDHKIKLIKQNQLGLFVVPLVVVAVQLLVG